MIDTTAVNESMLEIVVNAAAAGLTGYDVHRPDVGWRRDRL
jgi:hypothetical protein